MCVLSGLYSGSRIKDLDLQAGRLRFGVSASDGLSIQNEPYFFWLWLASM